MKHEKRFTKGNDGWAEEETRLKNYKGFSIYKNVSRYKGKSISITYNAYWNDEYFNTRTELKALKESIDGKGRKRIH